MTAGRGYKRGSDKIMQSIVPILIGPAMNVPPVAIIGKSYY